MARGAPSPIDRQIGTNQDGDPITVSDRIVASLRAGNYFEPSCLAAGINQATGYGWLRDAGKARLRNAGRAKPTYTKHEQRCLEFLLAVEQAESQWEVGANATLERLARGGIPNVTVTEKTNAAGDLIERTTRTEHTLPNAQVLEWRLTRRFPDRYRESIEVHHEAELSTDERAAALVENLTAYLGDVDAAATARKPAANGK